MSPTYFAQYNDNYRMMDGGDWGWGILMMLVMLLATIAVVSIIVRSTHWHLPAGMSHDDALDIAKKRYAKGDMTDAEFKRFKEDIK